MSASRSVLRTALLAIEPVTDDRFSHDVRQRRQELTLRARIVANRLREDEVHDLTPPHKRWRHRWTSFSGRTGSAVSPIRLAAERSAHAQNGRMRA